MASPSYQAISTTTLNPLTGAPLPQFPESIQNKACQAGFDGDLNALKSLVNEFGIGVLKSVGFVKANDPKPATNPPFQLGPLLGIWTDPHKARHLKGSADHMEFSLRPVGLLSRGLATKFFYEFFGGFFYPPTEEVLSRRGSRLGLILMLRRTGRHQYRWSREGGTRRVLV